MSLSDIQLQKFITEKSINDTKLSIKNLIDIYKDNWDYIIQNELATQFTAKSQKKLRPLISKEMNLIKRVTNETALVYKNNAIRKAFIKSEVTEGDTTSEIFTEDENYTDIMKDTNIDSIMKQVNKYTKLTNQTLLRVMWRSGKIDFDLLTFDNVEIFTDDEDWSKIIAVKYYIDLDLPSSENSESISITDQNDADYSTMFLWTLEDKNPDTKEYMSSKIRTYRKIAGSLERVDEDDNELVDEYGLPVLPFIFIPNNEPHSTLTDFSTGNDLLDGNINIALNLIHINNLFKYQSYKQMWIKSSSTEAFPSEWDLDPQSVIGIEDRDGNTDLGILDLQASIEKLWQINIERIILILGSRNIPPSAIRISGSPESGIKIRLDKNDLLESREDDVQMYRQKEKEIFKLVRIINNAHNTKTISEDAELSIDFGEITFPTTRQEDATADNLEIANNTLTGWQILQRKNPDLTDDEAKEKYFLNKEFNSESLGGLTEIDQPSNVEVDNG